MGRGNRQRGFTLVELITVVIILGIVGIGITSYLGFGVQIYTDAVGRERQLGDARFVVERLTRELREALPNSVRVGISGSTQCIEFLPIVGSATYVDIPVGETDDEIVLVRPTASVSDDEVIAGAKLVVYPLAANEIYVDPVPSSNKVGKVFLLSIEDDEKLTPIRNTADLNESVTATMAAQTYYIRNKVKVEFSAHSPTGRYYLVDTAVSYCADGDKILRYGGYWRNGNQQVPPLAVTQGILMAENQTNSAITGTKPFSVDPPTLQRNAIVQLSLNFAHGDEALKLFHEVHIANVP